MKRVKSGEFNRLIFAFSIRYKRRELTIVELTSLFIKRFRGWRLFRMKHKGTCPLETKRLYLRRFVVSDAKMVFENWSSDEEVTKFVAWAPHQNMQVTERVLKSWEQSYQLLDTYQWAIVDRESLEVIGSISLFQFHRRGRKVYCELGYCLAKDYWNKGLATEAARRVLAFAFLEVGVDVVTAKHDVLNKASGRVMQKLGMTQDKLVRRAVLTERRGWVDCDTYILLKEDFIDENLH